MTTNAEEIKRTRVVPNVATTGMTRPELKSFLKDLPEFMQFTYVRNRAEDGSPYQYGGAVVCWRFPENRNARMIEVSIAWCHDDERFDRDVGRYHAAQRFLEGQRTTFKLLPGSDSISNRIADAMLNGFAV